MTERTPSLRPGAPKPRVLVVDDEAGLRKMLQILFRREGWDATSVGGLAEARDAIASTTNPFALVITDLMMPDGSGLDLLSWVKEHAEGTEVLVMTAHSTVETAIDAMKRGAYDFITKPFSNSEILALAEKALERRDLFAENRRLRAAVARHAPRDLLGRSEPMRRIHDLIARIAPSKTTVLITGESGTGKERVARAVHEASDRRDKPFVVINCGAIPEALMESELFGHDKGAFTGAAHKHAGIFQQADGGTVLLDEIGELPTALQVKLLRVLQERKVRPVGSATELDVDVRVLAATNRDVELDVQKGVFRQDLYYRLNVIRIEIPPLRERTGDVGELVNHFISRCASEYDKPIRGMSADALRALERYAFPGNVRELENIVERAVALAASPVLGLGDLPPEVGGRAAEPTAVLAELPDDGCEIDVVLGELERRLILQALDRAEGVRTNAAKLLGISLRSLRYRLKKLGLGDGADDGADDEAGNGSAPPESVQ